MRIEIFQKFSEIFPTEFEFYQSGRVQLNSKALFSHLRLEDWVEKEGVTFPLHNKNVIAFRLYGDFKGLFLIFIEKDLDVSTYMEMGNIILGQLVTRLSNQQEIDLNFSYPELLSINQLKWQSKWLHQIQTSKFECGYDHCYQEKIVPVQILIFPIPLEEGGYA